MHYRRQLLMIIWGICSLLILLALSVQDATAANCYLFSPEIGYVCSPQKVPQPFQTPTFPDYSQIDFNNYANIRDFSNYYAAPSRDAEVVYNVGDGFLFATIRDNLVVNGERWYEVNRGQFTPAENVYLVEDSLFHGVELTFHPERPFGWVVVRDIRPSRAPDTPPHPQWRKLYRYERIQIYDAVQADDGWIWYQIGGNRWIKQTNLSIIDPKPRPETIDDTTYWVEVDLYEQTVAAYEGDRMVYASLISSGLNQWPTNEGLFQVWERVAKRKMSGAEGQRDYYFIEDVPYIMFFDNEIALHGAYWHDRFGYKHSHGCVNMPLRDAEWVFNWSAQLDYPLWVNVHTSNPDDYFHKYEAASLLTANNHR